MTTYMTTDPFAGSNGASWNASNWTNLTSTSGASATIQSNKGRHNTGTVTGYGGKRFDRWNGSTHADYEFTGTVTFVNTVDGHVEVWLRASTTIFDGTGYALSIDTSGSNNFAITKAVSYTYTDLVRTSFTISVGTTYGFRFYVVGTTMKAKIWDASGSEPGSYTISTTDSAVAAAGYAYLASIGGGSASFQVDWDNITLTDGTGNAFTFTGTIGTGLTGTLTKPLITKKPFTGTIGTGLAGTLTKLKVVTKTLTGTFVNGPSSVFIKTGQKVFTGTSTTTGVSIKDLFRTYTGTSTASGTFSKAGVRILTASISAAGTFTSNFLGRVFGRPGIARVTAARAAQAIIRIRRT